MKIVYFHAKEHSAHDVVWLACLLAGWPVGWLSGGLAGWLAGWLACGLLAGWLAGWRIGWLEKQIGFEYYLLLFCSTSLCFIASLLQCQIWVIVSQGPVQFTGLWHTIRCILLYLTYYTPHIVCQGPVIFTGPWITIRCILHYLTLSVIWKDVFTKSMFVNRSFIKKHGLPFQTLIFYTKHVKQNRV